MPPRPSPACGAFANRPPRTPRARALAAAASATWLLAIALAAPGCSPLKATDESGSSKTGAADERPISALGRLEPQGGVLAIAGPPGMRIGKLAVKPGEWVEKGALLFELDTLPTFEANREVAKAQLAEAEELLKLETENQKLLQQEFALKKEQVQKVEPLEIEAQESKIGVLVDAHEKAILDRDRLEKLREADSMAVSKQDLEAGRLQVKKFESDLKSARILLDKGRKQLDLANRRLDHEENQLAVATGKARLAARIASAKAQLGAAEAQCKAAAIVAPVRGRVLRLMTQPGESITAQPVLEMGDTGRMVAVAEVSELDVPRLREAAEAGPVRATVKSLRGQLELAGTIKAESIGRLIGTNALMSLNPAYSADQRVVEVEVALDEAGNDGKAIARAGELSNLQVDVEIPLADGPKSIASAAGPR